MSAKIAFYMGAIVDSYSLTNLQLNHQKSPEKSFRPLLLLENFIIVYFCSSMPYILFRFSFSLLLLLLSFYKNDCKGNISQQVE